MIGVSLLTNPAAVVAIIAPAIVNAWVAGGRLPLSSASIVSAAELAGMTVALLLGPTYVMSRRPRTLALLTILVAVAAHAMSLFVDGAWPLGAARVVAGASEGMLYAIAVAALAGSAAPDRAFGVMITVNHVASSVLLALIAWIALRGVQEGPVLLVALAVLLASPFVALLPRPSNAQATQPGAVRSGAPRWALATNGVTGVFLLSCGFGIVWPLIGQMAHARALPPAAVASGLSLGGVGGIVGGFVAALIGVRFGRNLPIALGSFAFAAALASPMHPLPFGAVAFAIMFFWTWCLPYYLGLVSQFDRSGRLAVVTTSMIPCGIAAGQAAGGLATGSWSLVAISAAGGALVVIAGAFMLLAARLFANASAQGLSGISELVNAD
jgi:predicted MFS family arabinose efflux permease